MCVFRKLLRHFVDFLACLKKRLGLLHVSVHFVHRASRDFFYFISLLLRHIKILGADTSCIVVEGFLELGLEWLIIDIWLEVPLSAHEG